MKLDLNLMRKMLLRIEETPNMPPKHLYIRDFLDLCERENVIALHLQITTEAKWIDAVEDEDDIVVFRLTLTGYDTLAAIRNDDAWRIAMNEAEKFGGVSFEIVKKLCDKAKKYLLDEAKRLEEEKTSDRVEVNLGGIDKTNKF